MIRITTAAVLAIVLGVSVAGAQQRSTAKASDAATSPVNLNTATAPQLETLPGIGRATAERIIEYRQKNGPFKKIEDLMNVRGIGEKNFLKLKPMIAVSPARGEQTAQNQ